MSSDEPSGPEAPLRIGVICPYSLTLPGGVQAQVLGLARTLRRLGHDARVLAPCDGPPPDTGVIPLGVSLPTAANGSMAPVAPDVAAQLRTMRALRDEEFDILHVHEPLVPGPPQTTLLVRNAPVVATFHAAGDGSAYDKFLGPALRRMADRIDVRVAVSDDARALAEQALGGTYRTLFNGIEVERFAAAEPWPTEEPTIFFLGRHEPRKGLDVLLAALPHLPRHIKVWIAGDGPDTTSLRRRYAGDPRIEWLGRITDVERNRRLAGADVFCVPSLHRESFGVVLLEGMAAGTPIVASDIRGYSNVARKDVDAILVPPGDPVALADAISVVLGSEKEAKRLSVAGRARAQEFSMERLASLYVDIYRELHVPTLRTGRPGDRRKVRTASSGGLRRAAAAARRSVRDSLR